MKIKKSRLLYVLGIVACLVLSFVFVVSSTKADELQNETEILKKISVMGTGIVKAKPDIVFFNCSIVSQEKEAAASQKTNGETSNNVVTALVEAGVLEEDISTASFNVSPVYTYKSGEEPKLQAAGVHFLFVCLLIIAGITAYSAWLMGPIVKDVFYGNDMNRALVLSATVVVIFIIKGFVSYLQSVMLNRIGNSMVARYQRRLFDHMLGLGVGFFNRQHSVELVSRLNQNIALVRDLLNTVVLGYVRDLVTLIALVGVIQISSAARAASNRR